MFLGTLLLKIKHTAEYILHIFYNTENRISLKLILWGVRAALSLLVILLCKWALIKQWPLFSGLTFRTASCQLV